MVVFPTEEHWFYGLLNSQLHEVWARETSGSIGTGLRYTPTDCLYTFPLPENHGSPQLADAAKSLERARERFTTHFGCSVNEMMDALHDPSSAGPQVDDLRHAQRHLDAAVARGYGWSDLDLDHTFRKVPTLPESDRTRFCISEPVRIEVIRRLADRNRQRSDEEQASPPATNQRTSKARSTGILADQGALDLVNASHFERMPAESQASVPDRKLTTQRNME
jgi:hypothetical protein